MEYDQPWLTLGGGGGTQPWLTHGDGGGTTAYSIGSKNALTSNKLI